MSASTQGLLFYGAVSDDFDAWQDMEEEHGKKALKRGLRFGSLADGETTVYNTVIISHMLVTYLRSSF